jgi:hypothetical protein
MGCGSLRQYAEDFADKRAIIIGLDADRLDFDQAGKVVFVAFNLVVPVYLLPRNHNHKLFHREQAFDCAWPTVSLAENGHHVMLDIAFPCDRDGVFPRPATFYNVSIPEPVTGVAQFEPVTKPRHCSLSCPRHTPSSGAAFVFPFQTTA